MKKTLSIIFLILVTLSARSQDVLSIKVSNPSCTVTVNSMVSQSISTGYNACDIVSLPFVVDYFTPFSSPDGYDFQTNVGFTTGGPSFSPPSGPFDHYYTDISFTANCGCPGTISGTMYSGPTPCLPGSNFMSFSGSSGGCTLNASWSYAFTTVSINFW